MAHKFSPHPANPLSALCPTGYQAFVLKDEPQSELERLNDEIQEYLRNSEKEFQKQFDPFLRTKEFRDLL